VAEAEVHAALSRALEGADTLVFELDLDAPHRFIIFSDTHKGARDPADEFERCEPAYTAALRDYQARGFSLILLGDIEELWEQGFRKVENHYADLMRLEAGFGAGRYYRVWGNHDDAWMDPFAVRSRLAPYMPTAAVYEGIRLSACVAGQEVGTLFMLHGHQGTFGSDRIRPVSRLFLRWIVRPLQRLGLPIGKSTPAKDVCLRGQHDREMYHWAERQAKLILIAGHTHRPVWSSRTHLQMLEAELAAAKAAPDPAAPEGRARIAELGEEIERRRIENPPCNDLVETGGLVGCYFNTGCCRFEDGDITGIELEDGMLRLVKWTSGRAVSEPPLTRMVLEKGELAEFFGTLPDREAGRSP
jgi:predicted phosphodiesterase